MNSNLIDQYYSAFESILGEDPIAANAEGKINSDRFNRSHESMAFPEINEGFNKETGVSDYLEFIMKFYPQSKNGITKQLKNLQEGQEFVVNGPFGKGLDLSPGNIVGNNVIFLGGTGVLPFIDLFAYLARMLISEKSPDNKILGDEDFDEHLKDAKFIVYAYYQKESEAIGSKFLRRISELFTHFNCEERLVINQIFTREGGERLNKASIIETLKSHHSESQLKNVWV